MILQKLKRWVAGVLAALLLVAVPARSLAVVAYADAAGATVTVAAAAGGGGLGAAAVGSVAAGVVAGALLALGVRAFVSGADSAGMTKTEYIGSLMEQWSQTEYDNAQQLADDVAYSTYVTSDGVLHIKEAAAKKIRAFGDWLIGGGNAESVPVYITSPFDGYTLGDFPLYSPLSLKSIFPYGRVESFSTSTGSPAYLLCAYSSSNTSSSSFSYYIVCERSCVFSYVAVDGSETFSGPRTINVDERSANGSFYYGYLYGANFDPRYYTPAYPVNNVRPPFRAISTGISFSPSGIIGNPTAWGENEDVIDLGKPDAGDITLNPDVLPNLDITGELTATQDLVISLQDYIQSLIDVINGYRDKVIDLTDALTGEKVGTAELPDIGTLDPSIAVPLNPEISIPDDAIGVIDGEIPAPPPPVPPGDQIIADYSYDLTSVFPFCIPFDIVRALSLLNAEPEAPKASFTWDIPLVGLNYTMEFDLAPWSGVAQVLRTMELLVFTIGLGLVTRKLIMA